MAALLWQATDSRDDAGEYFLISCFILCPPCESDAVNRSAIPDQDRFRRLFYISDPVRKTVSFRRLSVHRQREKSIAPIAVTGVFFAVQLLILFADRFQAGKEKHGQSAVFFPHDGQNDMPLFVPHSPAIRIFTLISQPEFLRAQDVKPFGTSTSMASLTVSCS